MSASSTQSGLSEKGMSYLADHVRQIPRSGIRDFFDIVQSMKDVISMSVGEPDFVTPWSIREAAIYSLEKGKTGYTSNLGTPALRREISKYVSKHYNVEYHPDNEILVSVGVSEALDLALRALINPGDEVIYHEPCYVSYNPSTLLNHGVPVPVSTSAKDDFAVRAEDIAKVVTPKSKLLLLNFPTNPTGGVLPREEQEKIAKICVQHDLILITDEIYSELTYFEGYQSVVDLPGMRERTIFLHGLSKAYAMTGWRIGYACAPLELIEGMMRIHQYAMMCASIMAQEAAVEALRNGEPAMLMMKEKYRQRRNVLQKRFNDIGLSCHLPQGAFYLFPNIESTGLESKEFCLRLLEEEKVAVVPGTAFGQSGEGFVRCSYATAMDQLEFAGERIARFVDRLS